MRLLSGLACAMFMAMFFGLSQCSIAASILEPAATQGATCAFGPYRSGAIGSPLGVVTDVSGANGNEVNAIYRVFYVITDGKSPASSGFAGWLDASFDGRFGFTPALIPGSNGGAHTLIISETQVSENRLPLLDWLHRLQRRYPGSFDSSLLLVLKSKSLMTAVSPCFSNNWDGHSS